MKPKAILLEPSRFSLAWLYQRYEIGYIIPDKGTALSLRNDPEKLHGIVYEWACKYFDPEKDHFVLTGNLTMLVIAVLAIQKAWPEKDLLMLRYDHENETYETIGKLSYVATV